MRHARYLSDAWKVRGVDSIARAMLRAGHRQVWAYRFDWDEEARVFGFDLSEALGAAHGMEIAFVFGQFGGGALNAAYIYDEARIPQRDALSDAMMSYWGAFAHAGAPGRGRGGKLPAWKPWGEGEQRMIVFDTEDDHGLRMSDEELTYAQLEERLAADESFEQPEQRCATYVRMFRRAPTFWNRDRYARFAGGVCAELEPEDLVD
jgi:para-nitrobenzyl esterase